MAVSWKLTEEQKCAIADHYRAGLPVRVIAARFGVSANTVSSTAIRRGLRRRTRTRKEQS